MQKDRVVKTVNLVNLGTGRVNITTLALALGIYHYTFLSPTKTQLLTIKLSAARPLKQVFFLFSLYPELS
jgi:hypothetical protein